MRSLATAAVVPGIFVFLWSTGWIAARAVTPFADPFTFLGVRFALAGVLLALFAFLVGASWPSGRRNWLHALASGVLLHAIYLGGIWFAVKHGVSAGMSGLIAALQPLFTAMVAGPLGGERIGRGQAVGVAIGLVGVLLVLSPKLAASSGLMGEAPLWPVLVNVFGMVSVTAGTFYQKRYLHGGDLRTVAAVQYFGAAPPMLLAAALLEQGRFEIVWQSVAALAWSVFALSMGAIALLLVMIRRGAVSKIASLNYLVPPAVAIEAWFVFGETLTPVQLAGMVVTALGVYLTTRPAA